MFFGVSKDLGNGFRVGVGTKLDLKRKKITNKELKSKEFNEFLKKVEKDLNEALIIFIEANNQDYYKLLKKKIDLDKVFRDNEKYKEFIILYQDVKYEIEKILYTGDNGVLAKRLITEEVYKIKDFINNEYPNFKPKFKVKRLFSKILSFTLKFILVVFILFLTIGFILNKSNKENDVKTGTSNTYTDKKIIEN